MKLKINKIIYILALVLLLGCVYENAAESKDGTASVEIDIALEQNGIEQNIFEKYNYLKIWFFSDTNIIDAVVIANTEKQEIESNKYLYDTYFDSRMDIIVNTKYIKATDENLKGKILLEDLPLDTKYILVGLPMSDNEEAVEAQFIKLNNGELHTGNKVDLYGIQYKNKDIVWNTNINDGEKTEFGKILLSTKENKKVKIQAVPQMFGKNSLESLYINGPFNAWDRNIKNYKLEANELGIYSIELENIAAFQFEYNFIWDDIQVKDYTANILNETTSKYILNSKNESKYTPIISLINPIKNKEITASAITYYPVVAENYDKDWENKGTLKIGVNTDGYMLADIEMDYMIDERNKINTDNMDFIDYEYEIWTAQNNNIKDVLITYEGKLDENKQLIESEDNIFGDKYLRDEQIKTFVVKKKAVSAQQSDQSYIAEESFYVLENLDIPNEVGIYVFKITAIDKNNVFAEQQCYLQIVD